MDFNRILNYAMGCVTQKYADFSGRSRRAEYWSFALCTSVITGVLNLLYNATDWKIFSILSGLVGLALLVPGLAAAWRRLHDIGKKGTWYFIGLIPIVGWIILIVWFCKEGEPGSNLYGPDPKLYD
jgi:Predicted membrane protein